MPRAYWKGYLRLSLVTGPIELFPATSQAEKTHFHQINTSTGHRLRQQMIDEQTGRVVDAKHKGRGCKAKGHEVIEEAPPPERPDNVIDLMDALRQSLGRLAAKTDRKKRTATRTRKAA
jgi:non-homologous end joining protein Ku